MHAVVGVGSVVLAGILFWRGGTGREVLYPVRESLYKMLVAMESQVACWVLRLSAEERFAFFGVPLALGFLATVAARVVYVGVFYWSVTSIGAAHSLRDFILLGHVAGVSALYVSVSSYVDVALVP